ncbi:MAG: substrate-binding domain-containing protein [Pseudomonadota bacterium]
MRLTCLITAAVLLNTAPASAITLKDDRIKHSPKDGVVRVFGPGGPHTALMRAAEAFKKKTGVAVEVNYGPESRWTKDAQRTADVLFGSSEQSMTAFLETYNGFASSDVEPIYIRRAVIAVQKGNPKNIKGFADLLKAGMRVVVTEGAGVYNTSGTGVWEDVAGRLGGLKDVASLRSNIIAFKKGSGASFRAFKNAKAPADAWITWVHWPLNNADVADFVELEPERRIHRVTNVVASPAADAETAQFIEFLKSDAALAIFESEGWKR